MSETSAPDLDFGNAIRAKGAILRQLHVWLKEQDATFGGLVRVQNRRREFLWVHPKFEAEY
jgi:internalin A